MGKNFKKPSVNPIFKEEAEKALFDRGFDVTVLWDSVVIVKNNKRVKVKCNIDGNIVERSLNDLRKGKYACRHCIEEKWTKLAYEKGYKIVDIDKSNCKVECLSCGAITNVTSERILGKNRIACKSCMELSYIKACIRKGLRYKNYHKIKFGIEITAECQKCNNELKFHSSTLLQGNNYYCKHCKENEITEKAFDKGWVASEISDKNSKLTCKICSHNVCIDNNYITSTHGIVCHNCRLNKYKSILLERGCTFISQNETHITFSNKDGEILQVKKSLIPSRAFATSSENHWTKPYELYVILAFDDFGERFVKIGIAKYAKTRCFNLKIKNKHLCIVLAKFKNRSWAYKAEQFLHEYMEEYRIEPNLVCNISSNFYERNGKLTLDGSTEWFSYDCVDELKKCVKGITGKDFEFNLDFN